MVLVRETRPCETVDEADNGQHYAENDQEERDPEARALQSAASPKRHCQQVEEVDGNVATTCHHAAHTAIRNLSHHASSDAGKERPIVEVTSPVVLHVVPAELMAAFSASHMVTSTIFDDNNSALRAELSSLSKLIALK